MALRQEFTLSMGVLALLNLGLAFGAVGLLTRMGPAIELIMQDNVYSIDAAEEILIELSAADLYPAGERGSGPALEAFARARQNVTEVGEVAVLDSIEASLPGAFAGEQQAKRQLLASVRELIDINREAMERIEAEAERLGSAGAWAAVLAGIVSFLLTLLIVTRLRRRFAIPLASIHQVLSGALAGDPFRRCHTLSGPLELVQVGQAVNQLLDERQQGLEHPR
ncbi:hypothetical protein [Engelhardtia mirabilis]|uniref:HAMP domain-containing protein n=1 Tax=Engelhardtia mirabilis TaxID=2528011 RepID=A0A518BQJ1_9BACT|nr:hypothetical protein Pla133_43650 [Planctomycetes bacterium Pla133]QDV03574.1 hypothetical protein Pla86_43640 [Planctomycetes bacterium Pla86]